jgi:hypothetical protein
MKFTRWKEFRKRRTSLASEIGQAQLLSLHFVLETEQRKLVSDLSNVIVEKGDVLLAVADLSVEVCVCSVRHFL